ncbi:unnamed protein product [Lactuca virosa]|uniref:Uncharacterized protein n=1 Tax=Lactuca virosa TaxID=75947 RepID=A0AAU9PHU4_9ASTR|nr:unnamed protein product [Lactuca virosa]
MVANITHAATCRAQIVGDGWICEETPSQTKHRTCEEKPSFSPPICHSFSPLVRPRRRLNSREEGNWKNRMSSRFTVVLSSLNHCLTLPSPTNRTQRTDNFEEGDFDETTSIFWWSLKQKRDCNLDQFVMASLIDAVREPIPTSAATASKHIETRCRGENIAFLKCKKDNPNPEICLEKGRQVSCYVMSLFLMVILHNLEKLSIVN